MGVATETHNRALELSTALAAARVRAATGNSSETNESLQHLDRVIADASATSFEGIVLQARLAKGIIEMGAAGQSVGRAYLEALQKDAAREGFQLMARKASAALQARGNRASLEVGN